MARQNYLSFATTVKKGYQPAKHLAFLADKLEAAYRGEVKRLMICMPPRHSKTETSVVRFIPWVLGKNPDLRIMYITYGTELAYPKSRLARSIVELDRYKLIFPGINLSDKSAAVGAWDIEGHEGGVKACGIGGGVTGHGFDILLIDDLIKNRKEAESLLIRENLWQALGNDIETRAEPDAAIIYMTTRWHEDDPAGRYLDQEPEKWDVINLPAIAEDSDILGRKIGEALWPERFPAKKLESIKKSPTLGTYGWNSLYQGRPSSLEGGILKRFWWKFWHHEGTEVKPVTVKGENGELINIESEPLPKKFNKTAQSWDMAFKDTKDSSYVVGQVWGREQANKYLLDQVREQMDFVKTIAAVKVLTQKWPQVATKWVEDKANGSAVIATLKRTVSGLIPVNPDGSKEARASAVSPQIESGNVYLPHPSIAPWVWDFIEECASFPNGANDDQVDAMSQALSRLETSTSISSYDFGLDVLTRESPNII